MRKTPIDIYKVLKQSSNDAQQLTKNGFGAFGYMRAKPIEDNPRQPQTVSHMPDTMDPSGLVERVQELTDLELAMLLSLVAGQHCIITAEKDDLDSLERELRLVLRTVSPLAGCIG